MNKRKSLKSKILYVVMMLLSAHQASAANFTIEPYGTLPTTVSQGQTVSATYTVTNMTNSERNGYVLQGLPAAVKQNTTAPNCGNPINLKAHATCQLQLEITGAVSSNFAICKRNSCTTATTPLNISLNTAPTTARFIYIALYTGSSSVLVCPVDETTGLFTFESCVNADPQGSLNSLYPQGIAINTAGTVAFIAGVETEYAYQCPIDRATGVFTTGCTNTHISGNGFYYYPYYGMLALDPSNSNIYLSNYSDAEGLDIIRCPVANGSIVNNCAASAKLSNDASSYGAGIVVNNANTKVYASMYSIQQVGICSIASWGSACDLVDGVRINNTNTNFSNEAGLALNATNSVLYIADSGSYQIYGCNPDSISGGFFTSCFIATDTNLSGHYPWGITINAKNTTLYFADYTDSVFACPVGQDGRFPLNTCTQISGFNAPVSTALLY